MKTLGWSVPFREQPWADIAARLHALVENSGRYEPVLDVVDSVIAFEAEANLAGCTSMTDLIVTAKPVTQPPMDVLIMRHFNGWVDMEHRTHTGRNDHIERPAGEAVALFWRFAIEKFGIHPTRTGAPPDARL